MNRFFSFCALSCLCFFFGCDVAKVNPRKEWLKIFRQCRAESEMLVLSNATYLGPANGKFGPGSLWAKDQDGHWQSLTTLDYFEKDQNKKEEIVAKGRGSTCGLRKKMRWSLKGGLVIQSAIEKEPSDTSESISFDLIVDLNRAKYVTMRINNWRIDKLVQIPYIEASRGWNEEYRNLLKDENCYVTTGACYVRSYTVDFEFTKEDALELKAKYTKTKYSLDTTLGGEATLAWKPENEYTLELTNEGDFYIFAKIDKLVFDTSTETLRLVAEPVDHKARVRMVY